MRHVMLDLETWARVPGAAIRSVGAVAFELEGGIDRTNMFYANVDPWSCWEKGLQLSQETREWWRQQSADVSKQLDINPQHIYSVVCNMHSWFWVQRAEFVWCNGANFDAPIWEAAAVAVSADVPWHYWNVRCCRTLCYLAALEIRKEERKGAAHNALDDAMHQVVCVQKAFAALMGLDNNPNHRRRK